MLLMDFIRGAGFQPGSVQCAGRYNIQRNCFFLNFSKAVVFFSKTPGNREVFNFQGFQMNMWCEHSFFQEACGASTALLAQLFSPENNGETRP